MAAQTTKRHLVVSFNNLDPELQEALRVKYPAGFSEVMIRIDKPNGDFFYAVPYETPEIAYLVKIDVKVDDGSDEDEEDKDYYGDDEGLADAEEFRGSDTPDEPSTTDDDIDI